MTLPVRRAEGHANISWWCVGCGSRNRVTIELNSAPQVFACERCDDGAVEVWPPYADGYSGGMGRSVREEADAA